MPRNLFFVTGLILSILFSAYSSAEVYKTVDKNGRITYTDVPPADTTAKPIELKSINNIPAPTPSPVTPTDTNTNSQAPLGYHVEILAPENGKTLLADERSITVSLSINQNLQNGDLFAYKLDGANVKTSNEMTYIIQEPPRGEHIVTVDVVNSEGKSLAQSNAVTVVVMRPLVKQKVIPVPKK